MTTASDAAPPPELCTALRTAADRLLAGTPLRSDGKLTIVSLATEAGIKRWILTHKYPSQLKDKYQAEFKAAAGKSSPIQAAERDTADLRETLRRARAHNRELECRNHTYATIIDQLTHELAAITAQRDALADSAMITPLHTCRAASKLGHTVPGDPGSARQRRGP